MNSICKNILEGVSAVVYNTSHCTRSCGFIKSATNYATYFTYLASNWAPRISYLQTTTAAYTPKRTQYAVYIVYSLIVGSIAHQIALDEQAAKKSEAHYLALRD